MTTFETLVIVCLYGVFVLATVCLALVVFGPRRGGL